MFSSIRNISQQTGVDARFILATIMQESSGCVRVYSTYGTHLNPGLMQSFAGPGTCDTCTANPAIPGIAPCHVSTPCPESEIYQMIHDGTAGVHNSSFPEIECPHGLCPGLQQNLEYLGGGHTAQDYYKAAKIYNSGNLTALTSSNLTAGCCTSTYCSDIANRLTGWVNAPRT